MRPMSATKRWRLITVVQRAGEHGLPGEAVVGEEDAVTEAIHAAAHPGRTRAAETAADEAGETETADATEGADESRRPVSRSRTTPAPGASSASG